MNTSSAIAELQREAEGIFASSGGVVVVAPDSESGSVIKLVSRTGSLNVKFFPERNAVRWDSLYEYGARADSRRDHFIGAQSHAAAT